MHTRPGIKPSVVRLESVALNNVHALERGLFRGSSWGRDAAGQAVKVQRRRRLGLQRETVAVSASEPSWPSAGRAANRGGGCLLRVVVARPSRTLSLGSPRTLAQPVDRVYHPGAERRASRCDDLDRTVGSDDAARVEVASGVRRI